MTRGCRGIVLPTVLVGLIGIGLVATGLIALTRSEVLSGRAALRYADSTARARSLLDAGVPERLMISDLPHGFQLVGVAPDTLGLTHFAVRWILDPAVVADQLPGAAEASTFPPSGVEVSPDCASSHGRPATRRPSSGEPRVGVLAADALVDLSNVLVHSDFPTQPNPGVFEVDGAPIVAGVGAGVLVSETDLVLGGTSSFRGLVVSAGSVLLTGSASVEGVVLAGGTLTVDDSALLIGCVDVAVDAIRLSGLEGAHLLPSGGFLGRF